MTGQHAQIGGGRRRSTPPPPRPRCRPEGRRAETAQASALCPGLSGRADQAVTECKGGAEVDSGRSQSPCQVRPWKQRRRNGVSPRRKTLMALGRVRAGSVAGAWVRCQGWRPRRAASSTRVPCLQRGHCHDQPVPVHAAGSLRRVRCQFQPSRLRMRKPCSIQTRNP